MRILISKEDVDELAKVLFQKDKKISALSSNDEMILYLIEDLEDENTQCYLVDKSFEEKDFIFIFDGSNYDYIKDEYNLDRVENDEEIFDLFLQPLINAGNKKAISYDKLIKGSLKEIKELGIDITMSEFIRITEVVLQNIYTNFTI